MTEAAPRTWRNAPRWLKIAFALSLVLNFLIIGLAAGAAIRWQAHNVTDGRSFAMRHILRHVPDERREAAKARVDAARGDIRARRDTRREARAALADAIAAESYDKTAVATAFANLRAAELSLREATHTSMADLIGELTAEDREDMADWMRRPRWHRGKNKGE